MATALKDILDTDAVDWLADGLHRAWPAFDRSGFVAACLAGLHDMELKARVDHIAGAMGRFLPTPFAAAADIVARALGPVVPATGQNGLLALRYFPHDRFIARFGLDDPQAAFALQEQVTRRCTCEFSIRAFIETYPEMTLAQLRKWATDPDPHLRRLASEGSRPRLPWGRRLAAFQRDPAPVIALLEMLKDDTERYVQRSVANSINDISKDHPDLAVALCASWASVATLQRRWLIGHALRKLVKDGHPGALGLAGAGAAPRVSVTPARLSPATPRMGQSLRVAVSLTSQADAPQSLLVDLGVHYVKATGGTRPKVFKLRRLTLEAGATVEFAKTISLAEMTTRKHHPGHHRLELLVNGAPHAIGGFDLLPA